jgi:hypothetical protein
MNFLEKSIVKTKNVDIILDVVGSSAVAIIHAVQQSRCTRISICGGGLTCVRNVPDVQETGE